MHAKGDDLLGVDGRTEKVSSPTHRACSVFGSQVKIYPGTPQQPGLGRPLDTELSIVSMVSYPLGAGGLESLRYTPWWWESTARPQTEAAPLSLCSLETNPRKSRGTTRKF